MGKILFINSQKEKCSIWESGFMAYTALKKYSSHSFDYIEISENDLEIPTGFDFYLFNYHYITMDWLDMESLRHIKEIKATLVLEVLPQDALVFCPVKDVFDAYFVLDPSFSGEDDNQHTFPRPLEDYSPTITPIMGTIPVIGSFGFSTPGKGFSKIIEAVNKEFDKAVIRLNIPYGSKVPDAKKKARLMAEECRSLAKPGVKVIVTHDYMEKQDLINWCASNTLNCFFYDRPGVPGLAATVDQAILSGKPLAVSEDLTFRHVHQYMEAYPHWSLKDSIEKSLSAVKLMVKDWRAEAFTNKFDNTILHYQAETPVEKLEQSSATYLLEANETFFIKELVKEFKTAAKMSFSQAGEDILLNFLFEAVLDIKNPLYVDIGANHPYLISNTFYFYQKGCRGVCLEPNPRLHKLFSQARPNDTCLPCGVGAESGNAKLYLFPANCDGLSTFSKSEADYWEKTGIGQYSVVETKILTLEAVIDVFLKEIPSFVTMDVEGMEMSILRTFDFEKYPIPCFCIETLRHGEGGMHSDSEIINFMLSKGYLQYAHTGINSIFVKKEALAKRENI